ncbi:hypothetical protein NQ317_005354 [Molorchus minor]|uniref:Uncharacterized protein n=1 Tax=Molorchus minor TaxID=1323400 RepID=A0ABQ9J1F7_9CUCU|nr:hypothetical protein NQ317_005354 [Molorchus minor]
MISINEVAVLLCLSGICYGQQFVIPDFILEAYEPSGFRASIPAVPGIERLHFHSKVNKPISQIEPGDFSDEITRPTNGYFTYYNPNLVLKKNDEVNYWVYVQYNKLGYRKDEQKWIVKELKAKPVAKCKTSISKVSNTTTVCASSIILKDEFEGNVLDENTWTLEQYIPRAPDYEFSNYKRDSDVTYVENGKLHIKPKLIEDEKQLKAKLLNLTDGCTRSAYCISKKFMIHNPVVSGRISYKFGISYGKFEIRARLPQGDWIYPELYLEEDNNPDNPRRIVIAYSRGNEQLTGDDGTDIGGTVLFGGPVSNHTEPLRSSKLSSHKQSSPFSEDMHTYTLVWSPDEIELFIDGTRYGNQDTEPGFTGENPAKLRLVIGVGVGGISDFPNDFTSKSGKKPWKNMGRTQVKDFFESRNVWHSTWSENKRQLEVEYFRGSSGASGAWFLISKGTFKLFVMENVTFLRKMKIKLVSSIINFHPRVNKISQMHSRLRTSLNSSAPTLLPWLSKNSISTPDIMLAEITGLDRGISSMSLTLPEK